MLPVEELNKKIHDAYACIGSEDISQFQKIDAEINALVPNYVQQVSYATSSVKNLNGLQWSTMFTQTGKIIASAAATILTVIGFSYLSGWISSIGSGIAMGLFLIYLWKKVPQIRQLRKDIQVLNEQSLALTNTVSQSILAISAIKNFQHSTIPTIEEWDRKGLWDREGSEKEQEQKFGESLKDLMDNDNNSQ